MLLRVNIYIIQISVYVITAKKIHKNISEQTFNIIETFSHFIQEHIHSMLQLVSLISFFVRIEILHKIRCEKGSKQLICLARRKIIVSIPIMRLLVASFKCN